MIHHRDQVLSDSVQVFSLTDITQDPLEIGVSSGLDFASIYLDRDLSASCRIQDRLIIDHFTLAEALEIGSEFFQIRGVQITDILTQDFLGIDAKDIFSLVVHFNDSAISFGDQDRIDAVLK